MDNTDDKDRTLKSEMEKITGENIVVRPDEDNGLNTGEIYGEPIDNEEEQSAGETVLQDSDDENRKEDDLDIQLKEAIHEQAREDERPQSSNFTLRKILGGDILTAQLLRNNIWLIVLIVCFIVVYITNRYKVQKDLLEIDKLNTELEDAKYRALSSSSNLTEKSRESHVLESLKNGPDSSLKQSDQPPYIIEVPEK